PIAAPNYKGTVKGNGYAINGLTQPLFDVTAASFKGLHLNVKIEETVKNRVGALACQIIANGNAPVVESCSVSGLVSATVDFKPATADVRTDSGIAGLVGHAAGVDFKDCTNKATVELGQLSTETKTYAPMAGIVGSTSVGNERHTQFTNCHNGGALNYYDTTGKLAPCIGGIVGYYMGENANATFDNCSNSGDITIHKGSTTRDCNVGGIVGYSSSSKTDDGTVQTGNLYFTNNTSNSGKITFEGTSSAGFRPGGIIGYINQGVKVTFKGPVTNSGSFTINGSLKDIRGGGILGAMYGSCGLYIEKGAHNTKSATMTFNGAASGGFMFGGMYGQNDYSDSYDSNGSTISGGKVVCNDANFTINGSVESTCYLAGFYCYSHNTTTTISGATRIVNNGKMHITKSADITSTVYLGGCLGYANGNRVSTSKLTTGQLVNRGEIRFEGKAKAGVNIGGVYGCHFASTTCPAINVGNIYAIGTIDTSKTIRVGGITGNTTYSKNGVTTVSMRNGTVYCDIVAFMTTVDSEGNHTFTPYNQVGMYIGRSATLSSDTKNNFIGGRIATTATVVNGEVVPTFVDITADNYLNYVRGLDGAVPAGTYFSHIASKNDIAWGSFKE
ncbi:MAG: hypothetical protein IKY57_02630, partial [Alistipes sp.]|nr:hypothetical protein [Alistipes sp.]